MKTASKWGAVSGTYTKGGAHIGISALLMNDGEVIVKQEAENKTDKITVAGQTVIYNKVDKPEVSYHYLNGYNEAQDAYYTVSSYGDKRLAKEQLLQLAEELVH